MKLIKALFFSITLALLPALLSSLETAQGSEPDSNSHPSVVIQYRAGATKLSDEDKTAIRSAVRSVLQKHAIDHVTIAAWSDHAFPAKGQKLSATDQGLAEERATNIREFVKNDLEIFDVDAYNMAESAHWLARTFGTKDAELKSVFTRSEDASVRREEFRTIRNQGGESRAVVVVVRDLE